MPVVGDLGEEVCEVGRVEGSDVKYPIRAALARYKDGSLRVGLNRVLDSAKGLVNFRLGRMDADEALGVAKLLTRAAKMMKSRRRKR
ncbi:MAG: hypothetical protein HYZ11_08260 [Candidatus Tectomicrobia bacterium]|uniref:Uncharacterized protein n=1 Tax=Tectimicrobiota bacterium TaxID=2528274 RepID=A0A932I0A9_UNCTE|nr:hypothetical protein [Candidatus Tectomicrobia bacterium]